jgi:hypothetical protein
MKLHGMLHNAEPEAGAARFPRAAFVDAVKSLKDVREIRLGDTGSIVAHTDLDLAFMQAGGHINP